jgi:hypothetical protein
MLLHVIETARPMDAAIDATETNRTIDNVYDAVFLVEHIDDVGVAEFAQVIGLAAGTGI